MTSNVPPAIRRKPAERSELLKDLEYFLGEVISRLERLRRLEPNGDHELSWRQSAQITRRVRNIVRHHQGLTAKRKLEQRRQHGT